MLPLSVALCAIGFVLIGTDAARVLVYSPSISNSHIIMNGRIADVLVKAGHDVTLFIPEYNSASTLNGSKLARIVRMGGLGSAFEEGMEGMEIFASHTASIWERIGFEDALADVCNSLMARKSELDELKAYGFDVAFSEMVDFCGLGVIRYLGITNHIWISTTPILDTVAYNLGVPTPLSYVPVVEENDLGTVMSLLDRAHNIRKYLVSIIVHHYGTHKTSAVFKRHVSPDFPNVRQIASESSLCFVNSDEFLDIAQPVLHKTVFVGGLGIGPARPLQEPFASLMEKGSKGVILMSLGTIVPTSAIPLQIRRGIFEAFANFSDYHFIVKVDKDDTESASLVQRIPNVDLVQWMPQSDILGHPRLRAFIMHGGFNGLLEAAIRGVPVVAIPFFADQFRNARTAEFRGFGIAIQKTDFNGDSLTKALRQIVSDPKYKLSAVRISKLIRTKPFKAEERFVEWTNFVIENGRLTNLDVAGLRLNFVAYHNLDCIAIALIIVALSVFTVYRLTRSLVRVIFAGKKKIE
ncbi:hypothetical protein QR680_014762 [Steinernema hermaphroditum]|uniref:UDP-glucuronosyltransferase n=1 Tax=Steinernema hermaphroditum TaxID=289476 RepID=A0AA39IA03_9BILA|nr:hypothetical protein QR680_014762 [Steinernema hermaphroditum]